MIERKGDLWEIAAVEGAAVVVTTNGSVRRDGCAVMGRGCALAAKQRFPGIDRVLGDAIKASGNIVRVLREEVVAGPPTVIALPVKHAWAENALPELIRESTRALAVLCELLGIEKVVLPRPGCGNGGLRWADVKPLLEPYLDGRFVVVHWPWEETDAR